jgi:hypothetical protein
VGEWVPMTEWQEEVPQVCSVCDEVYSGRELSYIPLMCEHEGCPGPTKRIYAQVKVDK